MSTLDTDIATWQKTKDSLLIGAASLSVVLITWLLVKTTNIEVQLATYSAQQAALEKRVVGLESFRADHDREDRLARSMGAHR